MFSRVLSFLPVLLLAVALPVQAEQYRDFGDYRVHYSAFKSDMLSPEIAMAYGLSRSHYKAVVNITVQKKDGKMYQPVEASVKGTARDIYSKIQNLDMKEVKEGKVVYYLAEIPITDEQKLTFNIKVSPKGENVVDEFTFERQFFVN